MKGVILHCLQEVVINHYGNKTWDKACEATGLGTGHSFALSISKNIDEEKSLELFAKCAQHGNVPIQKIFELFGIHWIVYTEKLYSIYYKKVNSSKEMIARLDEIHSRATKNMEGARPPRFQYNWLDANTLELTYLSTRNLIDLLVYLVKGLDARFNSRTAIEKNGNVLKLTFDD